MFYIRGISVCPGTYKGERQVQTPRGQDLDLCNTKVLIKWFEILCYDDRVSHRTYITYLR